MKRAIPITGSRRRVSQPTGRRLALFLILSACVLLCCVQTIPFLQASPNRRTLQTSENRIVLSLPTKAQNGINALAYSPNGKYLATVKWDTVQIWNASNGRLLRTQKSAQYKYQHIAFSPDSKYYAASGTVLRIWSTQTGRMLHSTEGDGSDFLRCCFFPDGKRLLTGSYGQNAKIWDVASGRLVHTLHHPRESCSDIDLSPNGSHIVTAHGVATDDPGFVLLCDVKTGRTQQLFQNPSPVNTVRFSPDGQRIVAACFNNVARVWDVKQKKEVLRLQGHTVQLTGALTTPDGKRICTADLFGTIKVWDANTGKELFTLKDKEGAFGALDCSSDGKRLFAADGENATVWNIE